MKIKRGDLVLIKYDKEDIKNGLLKDNPFCLFEVQTPVSKAGLFAATWRKDDNYGRFFYHHQIITVLGGKHEIQE